MQTLFRSMNSTYARSPDVSFLRLTTSPRIEARERMVDQVLADSFPASDPPPWTLGRATTAAISSPTDSSRNDDDAWSYQTTVIVPGGSRTAWQWLASGLGAIAVTLLLPISILVVGVPIAVAVRGILEALVWLTTLIVR